MASINKLKVGQRVYDYHKVKMGNTTMSRMGEWPVDIEEIDLEGNRVKASWNTNPSKWYYENSIKKWRVNQKESY